MTPLVRSDADYDPFVFQACHTPETSYHIHRCQLPNPAPPKRSKTLKYKGTVTGTGSAALSSNIRIETDNNPPYIAKTGTFDALLENGRKVIVSSRVWVSFDDTKPNANILEAKAIDDEDKLKDIGNSIAVAQVNLMRKGLRTSSAWINLSALCMLEKS